MFSALSTRTTDVALAPANNSFATLTWVSEAPDTSLDQPPTSFNAPVEAIHATFSITNGEVVEPQRRPRGRPRKNPKDEVLGPKRRPGRPRKDRTNEPEREKRPPGRPRKVPLPTGSVVFRMLKAPIKISASNSSRSPAAPTGVHPLFAPRPTVVPPPPPPPPPPLTLRTPSDNPARDPSLVSMPPPTTVRIIPDVDPQRPVRISPIEEEDDGADDGDGLGVGEEDDPGPEDEGVEDSEDEEDPIEHNSETNDGVEGGSPRQARCPPPTWLMDRFRQHLAEFRTQRDENDIPLLYSKQQTFWIPTRSTYLTLRSGNITPAAIYDVRFFVWDPKALKIDIPCPLCRHPLTAHGAIPRPRRCVDMDSTFYMIGFRYRCSRCLNKKSLKATVTFRSWDSRILAVLPAALAAEFPAVLTHRGALSKTLASWLRTSIMMGMGTKRFSDGLRAEHLARYDELHVQYLDFILSKTRLGVSFGQKFASFLPFADRSPDGFHGFTPSAPYLRDVYIRHMEKYAPQINQFVSLRPGGLCRMDHSHKLAKGIAQVEGEQIVTATMTVLNHEDAVRVFNYVATKAHSQYQGSLTGMNDSIELYGLEPVTGMYTDQVSDRAFLEAAFPSLRVGVQPVEKYDHLPPYTTPSTVKRDVRRQEIAINDAMRTILADVPTSASEPPLVVGFDCEWNVTITEFGGVESGDVAVVQIAYQDRVLILQIAQFVAEQRLPEQLVNLLRNPRVVKAGRNVTTDLSQLQRVAGVREAFVGGLDLASYAKARHVVPKATCSLADLCARTFNKCLNKNRAERISAGWENQNLTDQQVEYAATDAYICLALYLRLSQFSIPAPISDDTPPATKVLIYHTDNTLVIAYGELAQPGSDDIVQSLGQNLRLRSGETIVKVTHVLVPGAIISTHGKKSLKSFGDTPFFLIVLKSRVFRFDGQLFGLYSPPAPETLFDDVNMADFTTVGYEDLEPTSYLDSPDGAGNILRSIVQGSGPSHNSDSSGSAQFHLSDIEHAARDPESYEYGAALLNSVQVPDPALDDRLRTRVWKDVFHVFNMLRLPAGHGLRKDFSRMLRDALFVPDREDRVRISAWAATCNPPQTFESLQASKPRWLWAHCRRIIPPPSVIFALVKEIFLAYGAMKDVSTKRTLFNHDTWKTAKHILELIYHGYVSDPPGISLYQVVCLDAAAGNLPIYRTSRGTNAVEGGIHTHLRSRLPGSGVSIEFLEACTYDFVLGHNMRAIVRRQTGQAYLGHFKIWLTNRLQERLLAAEDLLDNPMRISGWINGDLYIGTKERIGVARVPLDIQELCGVAQHNPDSPPPPKKTKTYRWRGLAQRQDVRKAILPVHGTAEKSLFHDLMKHNSAFNSKEHGIRWNAAAKVWNEQAEKNDAIFYKLPEQLRVYYKKYQDRSTVQQDLSLMAQTREQLFKAASDSSRSTNLPSVSVRQRPLQAPIPIQGFSWTLDSINQLRSPGPHSASNTNIDTDYPGIPMDVDSSPTSPPAPSPTIDAVSSQTGGPFAMTSSSLRTRAAPLRLAHVFQPSERTPNQHPEQAAMVNRIITTLARQRVQTQLGNTIAEKIKNPNPRSGRTCLYCGREDCKGKMIREECFNPCRDCHTRTCPGRDPDYRKYPCATVRAQEGIELPPKKRRSRAQKSQAAAPT